MSLLETFLNSKEFAKLLAKGRDQSFLTPDEINDAIPANIVLADQIDSILEKIL
jgi:RNA polymerase primary sigma factor